MQSAAGRRKDLHGFLARSAWVPWEVVLATEKREEGTHFCVPTRAVLIMCVGGGRVGVGFRRNEVKWKSIRRWRMSRQVRNTTGAHKRRHFPLFLQGRSGANSGWTRSPCTGMLLGADAATWKHGTGKLSGSILRRGARRDGLGRCIQVQSATGHTHRHKHRPQTQTQTQAQAQGTGTCTGMHRHRHRHKHRHRHRHRHRHTQTHTQTHTTFFLTNDRKGSQSNASAQRDTQLLRESVVPHDLMSGRNGVTRPWHRAPVQQRDCEGPCC